MKTFLYYYKLRLSTPPSHIFKDGLVVLQVSFHLFRCHTLMNINFLNVAAFLPVSNICLQHSDDTTEPHQSDNKTWNVLPLMGPMIITTTRLFFQKFPNGTSAISGIWFISDTGGGGMFPKELRNNVYFKSKNTVNSTPTGFSLVITSAFLRSNVKDSPPLPTNSFNKTLLYPSNFYIIIFMFKGNTTHFFNITDTWQKNIFIDIFITYGIVFKKRNFIIIQINCQSSTSIFEYYF